MYVCICARVRENEIRRVVRLGAGDEDTVAEACGAGTGCGTCLERIVELLAEERGADTLAVSAH